MSLINQYIAEMQQVLAQLPLDRIEQVVHLLHHARLHGNQVLIMGNGGSASTATHFICDLGKNTYRTSMPAFRAIGLTDNMAIFSAIANDDGYENVFANQLRNLVQPNDVVIAISGSGNSENVLRAVELANVLGAVTVGFTGMGGGKLGKLVQMEVRVPSDQIQHVEDAHLILEHMIVKYLNWIDQPEAVVIPAATNGEGIPVADTVFQPPALDVFPNPNQVESIDYSALSDALECALKATGSSSGSILLTDPGGCVVDGILIQDFVLKSSWKTQSEEVVQNGLIGWVLRNRLPALVANTQHDGRWFQRPWETRQNHPRSAICAPLMRSNQVIGAITIVDMQPDRFTQQDLAELEQIAAHSFSTIPNVRSDSH